VTREIRVAFNFDASTDALAAVIRTVVPPTTDVVVGHGEHVNGIPLHTIAVLKRNETG
jgi:hypothetical protein